MVNAFTRGYHDVVARVRSLVYAVRLQAANRNEPPVTASDNDEGGYCSIETHVFSTTSNSNEEDFVDFAHSYNALWLCLFNLGIYYSLAVIGFSFVFEDWPIIDSLYFSTVTFTTVGYGDLAPSTTKGQIFTIFFAVYGITILGAFLGLAGEILIERNKAAVEVTRQEIHARLMDQFSIEEGDDDDAESNVAAPKPHKSEKQMSKEIVDLLVSGATMVGLLALLALFIARAESWTFMTAIYWTAVTACTVGYGDLVPKRPSVRLACILFIPFAVVVTGAYLTRVAGVYIARRNRKAERHFLSRSLTLSNFAAMDANNDGRVSKAEFLSFMLVALQKVEKSEIDQLIALFHKLDRLGDGYLDKRDLILASRRRDMKKKRHHHTTS